MNELEERVRQVEVRMAMAEQKMDSVGNDVKDIKNTLTWLNRLVIGALIVQLMSLVVTKI
jgi:uncharacterized protein Smg (DUF494 family)